MSDSSATAQLVAAVCAGEEARVSQLRFGPRQIGTGRRLGGAGSSGEACHQVVACVPGCESAHRMRATDVGTFRDISEAECSNAWSGTERGRLLGAGGWPGGSAIGVCGGRPAKCLTATCRALETQPGRPVPRASPEPFSHDERPSLCSDEGAVSLVPLAPGIIYRSCTNFLHICIFCHTAAVLNFVQRKYATRCVTAWREQHRASSASTHALGHPRRESSCERSVIGRVIDGLQMEIGHCLGHQPFDRRVAQG